MSDRVNSFVVPAVPAARPAARETSYILWSCAAVTLLIHLLTNSRYGFFRDELYFIACARHPAWGYVDFAPLSAWLLRLEMALFGQSLFAVRLFPALASAGTVALTGVLARQMGGRAWSVALACVGALTAAVYLAVGNFYSLNVFEPLFWMGCVYVLLRIINGGSARLWLLFGLIAGLGLQNKHSLVFFGLGLLAGIACTPGRFQFRQPAFWFGGVIAFLVALPNLLWQLQHGFPTLELLRNVARSGKNVALGPLEFIGQQVLIMNPATLPLWLAGLIWLLVAWEGRRYRVLAFTYFFTLLLFLILHGKNYYLAPIYPMLFAAGGVALERLLAARLRLLRPFFLALMVACAALLAPTIIPILPPEKLLGYMRAIHFQPPRTEKAHTAALPQLFADQFGWEEMVRSVARTYHQLAPADRERAVIFCQNYGQAGAIDFFGPKYGLPPAISGHQNYFLWGPRGHTGDVVLVIDDRSEDEAEQFRSVEDLGPLDSSIWAMPHERRNHLFLCRDLKLPLSEVWPRLKEWL